MKGHVEHCRAVPAQAGGQGVVSRGREEPGGSKVTHGVEQEWDCDRAQQMGTFSPV